MAKSMTVWGVGLKFAALSSLYFVLTLVAHWVWYPRFAIQAVPYGLLAIVGAILLAIGVPIWVAAAKAIDAAFEGELLATQGVYGLCRHPLYGNTIFFTIPGILLFFRSWLVLTVPVFMYVLFKLLIGTEERYLAAKFGPAYERYKSQVGAVLPRLWKLRSSFWYPVDTGQVAEKVYAVRVRDANLFIVADGEGAIAFDAAYGGDALQGELARLPIKPEAVSHLFLTHTDVDHTGGLDCFPNAQIYLSEDEEQMIDGTTTRLFRLYRNPRLRRPYTLLADGDVIEIGQIKVRAIATPGHTPGSMSYLVNERVLFTGDSLALQNGRARPFYRLFNMDTKAQTESIPKLATLKHVSLLCTAHTGCTSDYDRAMSPWQK